MHALFSQFSGLAGLTVFFVRSWNYAPVDTAFISGIAVAVFLFVALSAGDLGIRRVLTARPVPAPPAPPTPRKPNSRPEPAAAPEYEPQPELAAA